MRLIRGGAYLPDPLIQAHEDGDVVFFCGAGISYPAGLPGFRDLVSTLSHAGLGSHIHLASVHCR